MRTLWYFLQQRSCSWFGWLPGESVYFVFIALNCIVEWSTEYLRQLNYGLFRELAKFIMNHQALALILIEFLNRSWSVDKLLSKECYPVNLLKAINFFHPVPTYSHFLLLWTWIKRNLSSLGTILFSSISLASHTHTHSVWPHSNPTPIHWVPAESLGHYVSKQLLLNLNKSRHWPTFRIQSTANRRFRFIRSIQYPSTANRPRCCFLPWPTVFQWGLLW